MPGGKCSPLMKRTVREVKTACLCEKNAAVRARATAASASWLEVDAPDFRKRPRMVPCRSTTAIIIVVESRELAAWLIIVLISLTLSGAAVLALPGGKDTAKAEVYSTRD
ncbi:MAG: hypothetical protein IID17_11570 [Nitrospinae bacterium]|nr:hypothetical protein [Nitrospinota bacterium]